MVGMLIRHFFSVSGELLIDFISDAAEGTVTIQIVEAQLRETPLQGC